MNEKDEVKKKLVELITSRKFWAAAIGVIMLILVSLFSGFPEQVGTYAVEIAVVVSAYIVGVAIDPGNVTADAGEKFLAMLRSRKFLAAVVSLAVITIKAFYPDFPFDETQVVATVVTLSAYIFGTGVQDNILYNQRE